MGFFVVRLRRGLLDVRCLRQRGLLHFVRNDGNSVTAKPEGLWQSMFFVRLRRGLFAVDRHGFCETSR
jgi:hypothetical protein